MVIPLCLLLQHPRGALNPCLIRKAEALWMLNRFCRPGLAHATRTMMHVERGNALAA